MTSKRDLARGILWTTFLQDDHLLAALRDDSKIDVFDAEKDLVHKKLFDLDDFVVKIHGADSHLIAVKKNSVEIVDVTNSLKTLSTYKPSEHFEVFESSQFDTESDVLVVSNDENNAKKKRVEFVDWRTANASILLIDQNTPIGDHVVFTQKREEFAVTTPGGAVRVYDIRTVKNQIYQVSNIGKLRRMTFVNNRMCCITPGDAYKIYTKNECSELKKVEYSYEFPSREDWCLGFLEGNDKSPLFAIHGNQYNYINFSAVDQIEKSKNHSVLRYKALRPNCFSRSSNNKIAVGSLHGQLHLQICNFRSDNLHKEFEKIRDKNTRNRNQQKPKKGEVAAADQRHIAKELNEPKVGVVGKEFNLNNFQIVKMLGRGSFGYVQQVESVRTGKKFAMKVLPNTLTNLADRHIVEREILIQAEMQHKNVVSLITTFATSAQIHMIMELMSHSLRQKMISEGALCEKDASWILHDATNGIAFCHLHGVLHRDLKPENITISDHGTAKITDFGLSTNTKGLTACGTEQYKAPEIWAHEEQTTSVDMWSLGCIMFEALTKRLTFPQAKTSDMIAAIDSAKVSYPHSLSNVSKDLIQKLIVRKAGSRLTASQLLDHTWIQKYQIEKNRVYARELLNEI
ncbi:hypothetical protein CRE_30239 [Caenorhabditis remanei]|uniref:Protein kinase domain-containing protein n=1 Tax=Caenorhabditis remanei TaxID=31234 RepID=E3NJD0_CAERE|nr:hypothetical protein CRE_30239 [Caenorhabditis remanei]